MLIIRVKAHLLLIVGNKIVTKKRRNRFVVGFMCKGNKSPLTIKVKLAKRRILFFFSPATYNLPTKNRFSPFWIYKQRYELNL